MPAFSLVSWNINSVRARTERLVAWLGRHEPDILCLQEIKCRDEQFPHEEIQALGYRAAVYGQPTYNGVAILTRTPVTVVERGLPGDESDEQARFLAIDTHGLRVVNIYVPNGKSVETDKYAYKLAWLGRLQTWLASQVSDGKPLVVCGDYNIAPTDEDAAFPDAWAGSVLTHADVRNAWNELTGLGLVDLVRKHHSGPGPFTWWDYRQLGFPRNDGLRIDHHLATPAAAERCTAAVVDRDERKGDKPSDHAPVVVSFST